MAISNEWSICPYCGEQHGDVNESAAGLHPDEWHTETCFRCNMEYQVMVSYEIRIETRKGPLA